VSRARPGVPSGGVLPSHRATLSPLVWIAAPDVGTAPGRKAPGKKPVVLGHAMLHAPSDPRIPAQQLLDQLHIALDRPLIVAQHPIGSLTQGLPALRVA
jgi:hypothetical protein